MLRFLPRAFSTTVSHRRMAKTALIIGSNGSEEIELVVTIDVLRRAGIKVTIAGLQDKNSIECDQGVSINVDVPLNEVVENHYDAVVLPGGFSASESLSKDPRVGKILKSHESNGKIVAAICGAPLALSSHGIAEAGSITSYPSVKDQLSGPGTVFEFALKLVEILTSAEKAKCLRSDMLVK